MAHDEDGNRYVLFIGIIDILQSYVMKKKLEHTWKALVHDGVCRCATSTRQFELRCFLCTGDRQCYTPQLLRSAVQGLHERSGFPRDWASSSKVR